MPERLVNKFLIGCDPEFAVINATGELVDPEDFIEDSADEVGIDGCGSLVELRPKPHPGTYALLRQIQRLIHSRKLEGARPHTWRAGGLVEARKFEHECSCADCRAERDEDGSSTARYTMGGHIHLDIHPLRADLTKTVQALDRYTQLLEHLDILPKAECRARRETEDYGSYGDWRLSPGTYGDNFPGEQVPADQRVEYRTMPSWLFHPVPAFLALTGAKLAATAPDETMAALDGRMGYTRLQAMFELFKGKDVNADRALDKVLTQPVEKLQFDPANDFKETWRELPI